MTGNICSLSSRRSSTRRCAAGIYWRISIPIWRPEQYVTPFAIFIRGTPRTLPALASSAAAADARTQQGDQHGVGQSGAHGGSGFHAAGGVQAVLTQGGTDSASLDEAVRVAVAEWQDVAGGDPVLPTPASEGRELLRSCATTPTARSRGMGRQHWRSAMPDCGCCAGSQWAAAVSIHHYERGAGGCRVGAGVGRS